MAKIIDITSKIKDEKKEIKWGDKVYTVNDSKNAVTEVYAIMNSGISDTESITKALSVLLGEDAVKDFDNLSYEDYHVPFFAVMALVSGQDYEEVENSFRNTVEQS